MSEPYIGEIIQIGFNWPPVDYALCNGSVIQVNSNPALFSLLGIKFGGNGSSNFHLPDLCGRVPVGQGEHVISYEVGDFGGVENVNLTTQHLAAHTHSLNYSESTGDFFAPINESTLSRSPVIPEQGGVAANMFTSNAGSHVQLSSDSVGQTGGNSAHRNIQPCLAIQFAIALTGIYPQRN